ncbi:hypothetical protein STRAU_4632 [Streptomyces aurantiacus JA 4570]|uniref:Uncharacterized protein n=1 Tax=Streptomyces aurantiacus JA 4570 TaxID=1286094 RepID=S3ZGM0_9ACTN|nr:hypothetical protein STRAU_4632 [Streptomyces aurantiacus JA 4570]
MRGFGLLEGSGTRSGTRLLGGGFLGSGLLGGSRPFRRSSARRFRRSRARPFRGGRARRFRGTRAPGPLRHTSFRHGASVRAATDTDGGDAQLSSRC